MVGTCHSCNSAKIGILSLSLLLAANLFGARELLAAETPRRRRPVQLGFTPFYHWGAAVSLCFSPAGDQIAASGTDDRIHIWDVASATEKLAFARSTDRTISLAYS